MRSGQPDVPTETEFLSQLPSGKSHTVWKNKNFTLKKKKFREIKFFSKNIAFTGFLLKNFGGLEFSF